MSNVSNKLPSKNFWISIAHWLDHVDAKQAPKEYVNKINDWYDSFLESDDADDRDMRLEVKDLRDDMLTLFEAMDLYDPKERAEQIKNLAV